ncbi:MAG: hypothetical protein KY396_01650 [Actinobacteria bacterium]|nr:hypothetical protein [Actinomycetota bacterium]
MASELLAHGGTLGAIAEGAAIVLALAGLSFFVWRSTRRKSDEHDPARECVDDERAE